MAAVQSLSCYSLQACKHVFGAFKRVRDGSHAHPGFPWLLSLISRTGEGVSNENSRLNGRLALSRSNGVSSSAIATNFTKSTNDQWRHLARTPIHPPSLSIRKNQALRRLLVWSGTFEIPETGACSQTRHCESECKGWMRCVTAVTV